VKVLSLRDRNVFSIKCCHSCLSGRSFRENAGRGGRTTTIYAVISDGADDTDPKSLYSGPKIKYYTCPDGERKTSLGFCQVTARPIKGAG